MTSASEATVIHTQRYWEETVIVHMDGIYTNIYRLIDQRGVIVCVLVYLPHLVLLAFLITCLRIYMYVFGSTSFN